MQGNFSSMSQKHMKSNQRGLKETTTTKKIHTESLLVLTVLSSYYIPDILSTYYKAFMGIGITVFILQRRLNNWPQTSQTLNSRHLMKTTSLLHSKSYLHYIDLETEVQGGSMTCSGSHS